MYHIYTYYIKTYYNLYYTHKLLVYHIQIFEYVYNYICNMYIQIQTVNNPHSKGNMLNNVHILSTPERLHMYVCLSCVCMYIYI